MASRPDGLDKVRPRPRILAVGGCVVHSDHRNQFRSRRFVLALSRNDMVGSMGRVGAAGDNAAMESFFSLLQKNVLGQLRMLSLGFAKADRAPGSPHDDVYESVVQTGRLNSPAEAGSDS